MGREEMVGRTFVELADTLVEGYDLIEFLYLLAERCVSLVSVAEGGVVLVDPEGNLRTLASSTERMRLVELVELQRQEGPCLDCYRQGAAVVEHDLENAAGRWPNFGAAALDAGFRSVYALPLRLRAESVGALNLMAERPSCLTADDLHLAQALADVATIGILHERVVRRRDILAEQLQMALDSRVTLEQAKGLIAEQAGVDMDQAFRLLRAHARGHNRYMSEVVAEVVARRLTASDLQASARTRRTGVAGGA